MLEIAIVILNDFKQNAFFNVDYGKLSKGQKAFGRNKGFECLIPSEYITTYLIFVK